MAEIFDGLFSVLSLSLSFISNGRSHCAANLARQIEPIQASSRLQVTPL